MRYRLNKAHFLGTTYHEAGAVIEWGGKPSSQMVALEQPAPAAPPVAPVAAHEDTGESHLEHMPSQVAAHDRHKRRSHVR